MVIVLCIVIYVIRPVGMDGIVLGQKAASGCALSAGAQELLPGIPPGKFGLNAAVQHILKLVQWQRVGEKHVKRRSALPSTGLLGPSRRWGDRRSSEQRGSAEAYLKT